MEEKQLTVQALKKLTNMHFYEKVRLFARCAIFRQNIRINGLLIELFGIDQLDSVKAEIVHHLFDENDQYKFTADYNQLMETMKQKKDLYKKFDTYTLCAYALYYDKFIELSNKAHSLQDIRTAKEFAYNYVSKFVDRNKFNLYYKEDPDFKTDSMLKKEYRRSLVKYLQEDLNIKDGFEFLEDVLKEEITDENYMDPYYDPNKTYANQVEEYYDENGNLYYLNAEGELIDCDDIEDFEHRNIKLTATENGIQQVIKRKDLER